MRGLYLFRSVVVIVEKVELLQAVVFELIFFGGSIKLGDGIDDGFETRLVIGVFHQRLEHLGMSLRTGAERVEHFPPNAFSPSHLIY